MNTKIAIIFLLTIFFVIQFIDCAPRNQKPAAIELTQEDEYQTEGQVSLYHIK